MDAEEDWDSWLAAKLEKDLAIADEAFAEYITQLCSEDTMEDDERREVIVEFLDEASAGQPVAPCVDEILAKHAERQAAAAAREKEDRAKSLHEAKQRELEALQADTAADPSSAAAGGGKKKVLSLEEKLARDRLLALYGYESEDHEGDDAEGKSGGDGSAGAASGGGGDPNGLLMKNDNAERVRAEEQAKKAKAQAEHQKNVQRNKENVEKQKAEREKEKKRTVKKEKRRM
ncbi:hypothetical protein HDU87_001363 [Geranomyces variabilis]|uniref:CCDC43 PWI-like domain-containing protein n=1 Tax=Geranomyces variabilis TaxID=109894 RepID=A0AAD5XNZ3_9FUNG|nr:hypothetical protein HDU87_001363 [Geranomyces variabilis]